VCYREKDVFGLALMYVSKLWKLSFREIIYYFV